MRSIPPTLLHPITALITTASAEPTKTAATPPGATTKTLPLTCNPGVPAHRPAATGLTSGLAQCTSDGWCWANAPAGTLVQAIAACSP